MNFIEKLANYRLGNLSRSHFPSIAMTAMEEGIESESILILASMSDRENTFELEDYFQKSLRELHITIPNKLISAKIVLHYYLDQINENQHDAYNIVMLIDNNIYKQADWISELNLNKVQFDGEELGLDKIYTWYRELQDFQDGSRLLYYNELSKRKQKEKLEFHLIEEASLLKEQLEQEVAYSIKNFLPVR